MEPTISPEESQTSQPLAAQTTQSTPSPRRQAANVVAAGLLLSFFLPWIDLLFVRASAFDLQRESQTGKLLWLMPIMSLITLFAGLSGRNQRFAGQLAGISPVFILIYGLSQTGTDLFQLLAPGAWLALVLGIALFVLARK